MKINLILTIILYMTAWILLFPPAKHLTQSAMASENPFIRRQRVALYDFSKSGPLIQEEPMPPEEPYAPEEDPYFPDEAPYLPEDDPYLPEEPYVPEQEPLLPEEDPGLPEQPFEEEPESW